MKSVKVLCIKFYFVTDNKIQTKKQYRRILKLIDSSDDDDFSLQGRTLNVAVEVSDEVQSVNSDSAKEVSSDDGGKKKACELEAH